MMLNVSRLRQRPREFARLVGLSVAEFDTLLEAVTSLYQEKEHARLSRETRRRAIGGGRRFALSLENRLPSTLLYYRLNLTNFLLGVLFEIDPSNLWRERQTRMVPVLQEILPVPMQDHLLSTLEKGSGSGSGSGSAKKRIGTLRELLEAHPELRELCVDATEQQVQVPGAPVARRQSYSGKSHCHTVKTQVTTANRLILHQIGGVPGSCADVSLLKASGVLRAVAAAKTPSRRRAHSEAQTRARRPQARTRRVRMDRGYCGVEKEGLAHQGRYGTLPAVELLVSLKSTSKAKVTLLGQAWNHCIVSPKRMQVEQNIGHLQHWRLLEGRYRARLQSHNQAFALVAGLHNFKMLGSLNW